MNSTSLADRFWAKVSVRGPNDCWVWTGYRHRDSQHPGHRYGLLWNRGKAGPAYLRAHRVSWELHFGPVPDGLFVCHRCDNPPCVNPAHLFVGTHQDNTADATAKGRMNRGDANIFHRHPELSGDQAKLREADIPEIFAKRASGLSMARIGAGYGVSGSTIRLILRREIWKHVPIPG